MKRSIQKKGEKPTRSRTGTDKDKDAVGIKNVSQDLEREREDAEEDKDGERDGGRAVYSSAASSRLLLR